MRFLEISVFLIIFLLGFAGNNFSEATEAVSTATSNEKLVSTGGKTIPIVTFDHSGYSLEDTVIITVKNIDANQHPSYVENISVDFSTTHTTELTSVQLFETGQDTGIFVGSIDVKQLTNISFGKITATYQYKTSTETKEITIYAGIGVVKLDSDLKVYWQPSIETKIFELANAPVPEVYAFKKLIPYSDGNTRLIVEVGNSNVLEKILEFGGQIEATAGNQIQITLPVDKISDLSKVPGANAIHVPFKMHPHQSITSQGVLFINAQKAHDSGYTGNGIKVAVIDLAFNTNNEEIKDNIEEAKTFRKTFLGKDVDIRGNWEYGEDIHGTAVAEIITDVAPRVDLYLYTVGTEVEFQNAVDYAVNTKKVDIITMSAGWPNYLTNGQSSITKKLEQAVNNGVTFVISAGNYALTHWEGKFSDPDSNKIHNFSSGSESLIIHVESGRTWPILVYLLWDSSDDFSMVLKDPNGQELDISKNNQIGGYPHSMEYISVIPEIPGTHTIEISYEGTGKPNVDLEIFSTTEKIFEFYTKRGSAAVPTDAKGAIKVGAVYFQTGQLEDFSSQGPTNNDGLVPNVVGPDGVTTLAFGNTEFLGTSAAAPHIAGLAALLLEKDPQLTPQQILEMIQNSADKNLEGQPSPYNNQVGYGKADATFIFSDDSLDSGLPPQTPSQEPSDLQDDFIPEKPASLEVIEVTIPEWIKDQTKWWIDNAISDSEFVDGIQYLMEKNIIVIPEIPESKTSNIKGVPSWVKDNARWWIENKITDNDFAKGLEYLVKEGIIQLN